MVKVPPPKGKGEPPAASDILGNLDKPESEALVPLNFKVSQAFRREFQLFAPHRNGEGGCSSDLCLRQAEASIPARAGASARKATY
jgi:hypothetical protein